MNFYPPVPDYKTTDQQAIREKIEQAKDDWFERRRGKTCGFDARDVRMILEDALLHGSAAIGKPKDGYIDLHYPISVTSISLVITWDNKIPDPPNPAYMQIFNGIPMWTGTKNDLIFYAFTDIVDSRGNVIPSKLDEHMEKLCAQCFPVT